MLGPYLLGWISDKTTVQTAMVANALVLTIVVLVFGLTATETSRVEKDTVATGRVLSNAWGSVFWSIVSVIILVIYLQVIPEMGHQTYCPCQGFIRRWARQISTCGGHSLRVTWDNCSCVAMPSSSVQTSPTDHKSCRSCVARSDINCKTSESKEAKTCRLASLIKAQWDVWWTNLPCNVCWLDQFQLHHADYVRFYNLFIRRFDCRPM